MRTDGQKDNMTKLSRFSQFWEGAQKEFKKSEKCVALYMCVCGQQLRVCLCSPSLLFLFFLKFCFCLVFDSLVWTWPNMTFRKMLLFPTSDATESEVLVKRKQQPQQRVRSSDLEQFSVNGHL